tara:strand:+ start:226 stop:1449 length:1224 start_codon:yes stop_codon:yes gene_type:complete
MNLKPDVLIVGAGVAGITCAIKCQEKGINFLIIEKNDRVGGRLGSLYEDGYTFDIGFQVFNSSYHETKKFLDLNHLALRSFKPGAAIFSNNKFKIISDPFRDLSKTFNTLFSDITTLADKFRILKLKFELAKYSIEKDNSEDVETLVFLKNYGFSEQIIANFFTPFFAGVFLEKKLQTSSKFFKYVFSKFGSGLASLPLKGMQEIPKNMLRNINQNNLLLNCQLELITNEKKIKLKNGPIIHPNRVILTGNSQQLIYNDSLHYNRVKTLYFSYDNHPKYSDYIHIFPEEKVINNVAFLTSISSHYSKNNDNLLSVSIIQKIKASENNLKNYVKDRLENIYGGEFKFLKYFDIKQATTSHPVNSFGKNIKNSSHKGIYFSGDNLVHGSIEGAVISAIQVTNELERSFN